MGMCSKIKRGLSTYKQLYKKIGKKALHPWYIRIYMLGYDLVNNPYMICFNDYGEKNKDKNIFIVELADDWVPTAGFFALLNRTVCTLSFADRFNLTPVIKNWKGCAYEEKGGFKGTTEVFEYYFKPVSDVTYEEAFKSHNVAISTAPNRDAILVEYNVDDWFHPTEEYCIRMAELYKKYISLNEYTANKLKTDMDKVLQGKKTLAIHFRGTDSKLNTNYHPKSLTFDDYVLEIEKVMKKNDYEQIFLATDDLQALAQFKEKFKNIVHYEDVFRTEGNVSVAYTENSRENNSYLLGYEVIRDAFTMASCQGLIAGKSQVSISAYIINKAYYDKYVSVNWIDKGSNKNGVDWMDIYNKEYKDCRKKVN
ncbi:O-fucosyltransferase family protein [Anaerosporobacter faecicola]|uniref:hypothetical protein n=1 Tax=Anaerosporobacter faecicola TaxID=2718714 RepID=UPI001438FB66|nr:hypothetical protein [Anaerosporobacter faecicola]